jgi:hypothetical protein
MKSAYILHDCCDEKEYFIRSRIIAVIRTVLQ